MDVILLERINKLGQMGETVKVRDGYARNFLLPQGKALRANATNKARFETERATLEARNLERKSEAQKVAEALEGKSFIVVRSAGETGQALRLCRCSRRRRNPGCRRLQHRPQPG